MRGLSRLIPQDVRDSLNSNPLVQWIVVILLIVIGIGLALKGINGVKNKRITGKYGRVFEGTFAQVLGVIYAILGVVLALMGIATIVAG